MHRGQITSIGLQLILKVNKWNNYCDFSIYGKKLSKAGLPETGWLIDIIVQSQFIGHQRFSYHAYTQFYTGNWQKQGQSFPNKWFILGDTVFLKETLLSLYTLMRKKFVKWNCTSVLVPCGQSLLFYTKGKKNGSTY